ncbi:MAG: hypothetical protein HQL72_09930 [Magnetococcales bacterium]|nr:hypothetical protein [Magnetococcales bacterium]
MARMRHFFICGSLFAALLISTTAQAENLIVYSAKGVSYQSGEMIDGSQPLALKPGEEVSLISPTGRMIKLVGPYEGAPLGKGEKQEKKSVKEAIKNLLTASGSASESFGITRSADDLFKLAAKPAPLPNPWVIDVTQNGPYCYLEGESLVFWRPEKNRVASVNLEIPERGWSAKAEWASGKSKLAPPRTIPLHNGVSVQITLDNQKVSGIMNRIPRTVQSAAVQAAWLKERGCLPQFLTLAHSML